MPKVLFVRAEASEKALKTKTVNTIRIGIAPIQHPKPLRGEFTNGACLCVLYGFYFGFFFDCL
jgi:hypothetical protein